VARRRIGTCLSIPLPDGRWAYCQYVHRIEDYGDIVRVFDCITDEPLTSCEELKTANLLFPPVFAALIAALRGSIWQVVGYFPVEDFVMPKFRFTMGTKPGTYFDWQVWDGRKTKKIGALPAEMRTLELRCVWGCLALAERIAAGTYRGDRMF
jgi:hypothetical protein